MDKGKDGENRKRDGSAAKQATLLTGSECLERDCKRLRSMQIFTGFGNVEDAVTRLLPFHVCVVLFPHSSGVKIHWSSLDATGVLVAVFERV